MTVKRFYWFGIFFDFGKKSAASWVIQFWILRILLCGPNPCRTPFHRVYCTVISLHFLPFLTYQWFLIPHFFVGRVQVFRGPRNARLRGSTRPCSYFLGLGLYFVKIFAKFGEISGKNAFHEIREIRHLLGEINSVLNHRKIFVICQHLA